MTLSEIEVRSQPAQSTMTIRRRISMQETDRIPGWIGATFEAIQRASSQPTGMPFVRTLSMDADEMDIEVGWPVQAPLDGDAEVQPGTLPGGPVAVASYFGPYHEIGPAYEAIQAWCAEHDHEIAGSPWESYFTDPNEEPDPSKWRTDIHFPIRA